MTQYALFCLIMGPFKGEVLVFAKLWPVRVRVRAIVLQLGSTVGHPIATAGLLVCFIVSNAC